MSRGGSSAAAAGSPICAGVPVMLSCPGLIRSGWSSAYRASPTQARGLTLPEGLSGAA